MRPNTPTGSVTGSSPKTRTTPASARHKPRMRLISVDLAAPLSPTSPNTQPRGTDSETEFRATLVPKMRERFEMETTVALVSAVKLRIRFPGVSAATPRYEFVFDKTTDFVFSQVQGFKPV